MKQPEDEIWFYGTYGRYGCFSNFYRCDININGTIWPTSEHYFQAQKFAGTCHESDILNAVTPSEAARMGRSHDRPLRPDWEQVKDSVMYDIVLAKFKQHPALKQILLSTGNKRLVEHTERDRYWGDGGDGSGSNMLGRILMLVREELRNDHR